ncbi:MAG: MBL fold metallo-hydrolase [Candidatus Izemoplasmatales bacterium]|jgi:phosphoribosyl 1,2-cyclic phosphodiesterase|nr:MBL fold metallo-hydrolase [Candidatus Izemoplasmatales bacterium]
MRAIVLASGSSANATYLEISGEKVLIDCGLSYRQLTTRLKTKGKDLEGLKAVFITHEHADHVAGLRVLANKHKMKIILSQGTYDSLDKRYYGEIDEDLFMIVRDKALIDIFGFKVMPFETYHDATEPFGYRFIEGEKSLVYITDTGYFPIKEYETLRNADAYIIESNHEVEMLLESARPWQLKRRILDDQGHLSNEDSANLLLNIIGEKTKFIVLAHLSRECNLETLALSTHQKVFFEQGIDIKTYNLIAARQNEASEEIIIE